ncbi:hypothetical protein ACK8HX_15250 [Oryzobacter sp. R7]|uniref:hypothetical protein n=1 Tax=Oryzobacter faecalis TaxID=3388656 RepID=UPI00398D4721
MADPRRPASGGRRSWLLTGALLVLVVVLVLARGPVALLAAASVALIAAFVIGLPPLLRPDGIDWDWRPGRADEVVPEPGIAAIRRLLAPAKGDDEAVARLHEVLGAVAADRAPRGLPEDSRLAAYLAGPPRSLSTDEVDALVTELEALSPKESP